MGWLKDLLKTRPEQWIYEHLLPEQTPDPTPSRAIKKDEEYVHIYLKSTRIGYARKGVTTYYGVVNSFTSLLHRGGKNASFNVVTTPGNLQQLNAKQIQNVIITNKPLLGPIPYRGGAVEFELGLSSVPTDNLAKPFISLLTELSSTAGVSFISAALPFTGPIETGISLLAGAQQNPFLEIGLSTSFTDMQTGYYVLISAEVGRISIKDIKVENNFTVSVKGQPLRDESYIVFQIFAKPDRDDWFNIPEISMAYSKLQEQVNKPDYEASKELLKAFRRIVYTSNDIINADAQRIYDLVSKEIGKILEGTQTVDNRGNDSRKFMLKDLYQLNLQ